MLITKRCARRSRVTSRKEFLGDAEKLAWRIAPCDHTCGASGWLLRTLHLEDERTFEECSVEAALFWIHCFTVLQLAIFGQGVLITKGLVHKSHRKDQNAAM